MDRVLLYNRLGSYFAEDPGGLPVFLLEENKYGLFLWRWGIVLLGVFLSFFFLRRMDVSFPSLYCSSVLNKTWRRGQGGYKWHMDKQVIDLHNRPTH